MGTIDWVDMQDINGTQGQPTRGMNAANVESQVTTIAKTSIMYPAVLTAFSLCAILLLALFLLTHNSCCHKRRAAKGKKEERETEEIAGTHHTAKIFYDIPDQSHPKLTSVLQQEDNDIASEVNEHYKVGDCNRAIICCPDKDGYVYDPRRGKKRFESPTDETTSGTMPNTTSAETSSKDPFASKNVNKSSRSEPVTSKDKKGISIAIRHLTEALHKERTRAMTRTQSLSSSRDLKDANSHNKRSSDSNKKRTKSFDPNLERAFCLPRRNEKKKTKKTRQDRTKSQAEQDQGSTLATKKGDHHDELLYSPKDQNQQSIVPEEIIKNDIVEENSKTHDTTKSKELVVDATSKHLEHGIRDTSTNTDKVKGSDCETNLKTIKAQDRPRLFSDKELKHTVDFKGLLIDRWVDDTIKRQGTSPTDKESETTCEIQTQLNLLYDDADSILTSVSRMDEKRLKRLRESKFYKTALNTQKEEQNFTRNWNDNESKQDEEKGAARNERQPEINHDGKSKPTPQNNKRDTSDIAKHRKKKTTLSYENIISSNDIDTRASLADSQIPDDSQKNIEKRTEKTKHRTCKQEQRSIKTVNATVNEGTQVYDGDNRPGKPRWEEVTRADEGNMFSDVNVEVKHFTSLENNQTSSPGDRVVVTDMTESKEPAISKNNVFNDVENNGGMEQPLSTVDQRRIPAEKHATQIRPSLGKQAKEENNTFSELGNEKLTKPHKILKRQNSEKSKHRRRKEQSSNDLLDKSAPTEQSIFDSKEQSAISDSYFPGKGTSYTHSKGKRDYQGVVDDHNERYWDLHDNIVTDSDATYEPCHSRPQTYQRRTTDNTGEGTSSERWMPKDASTGINSGMTRQRTLQKQYIREKHKERASNPSVSFSILKNFKNARKPIIYVSLSKLTNLPQMEKNYSGQLIIRSYLQKHSNSTQESKPFECKNVVHVNELFLIRGPSTEKLLEDKLIFDFLTVPDKVLLGHVQVSLGELIDKGSVSRTDIIDLPTLQDTDYSYSM